MELITFEMRELKAAAGKVLTNGETFSSVGGSVYLGVNDNPENWHEITEEEYNAILSEENQEGDYNGNREI